MNRRLLFAIVSTAFVEQAVITIVRVATTYRAVELDLSVVWLGVITAVYARAADRDRRADRALHRPRL